jgi:hypothetical protein
VWVSSRIVNNSETRRGDIGVSATASTCQHNINANGSQRSSKVGALNGHDRLDKIPLDLIDNNLDIKDQAHMIGFIETSSEVQWLQAVTIAQSEETYRGPRAFHQQRGLYALNNEEISLCGFWTDSDSVKTELRVDPYKLPPLETAK